jgi:hypothetical protein
MYGKAFASMYSGSMFGSGFPVFAVWNYALANADRHGSVELNSKLLAAVLGGPVEEVAGALEVLLQVDTESRSKVEEGRRLIRTGEYSYTIVNHAAYSSIRNADERRVYNAGKMREYRASKVDNREQSVPPCAHIDVDVDVHVDKKEEDSSATVQNTVTEPALLTFRTVGKPAQWSLTQAQVDLWVLAYPQTDVLQEARKALAWLEANNRKTARGMPAFLVRWLGKAANGPVGASHAKAPTYKYAWMDPANDGKLGEQE